MILRGKGKGSEESLHQNFTPGSEFLERSCKDTPDENGVWNWVRISIELDEYWRYKMKQGIGNGAEVEDI
jgi:hypothetical protein